MTGWLAATLVPRSLRGYRRGWLGADVVAGLTLAAIAIPEVMGYTSISRAPVVTGLYTLLLPLVAFAVFGASKLLVVSGDSATAAILASGLASSGLAVQPDSPRWVALCSMTALLCAGLLIIARLLRLGFIGDFLSATVLVGFLTGVGVQVATSQIPSLLGISKGDGSWLQEQWHWLTSLHQISWATVGFGVGTIVLIGALLLLAPKLPAAIIAVAGAIVVAALSHAAQHGVRVVGTVQGGLPQLGLPGGLRAGDIAAVATTALTCFAIIVAQSAATSRSFAMKHGDRPDVNRDLVGLAAANLGAGISGTFVVNGSPTKTKVLDEQRGRTQVANLVVAAVTLLVLLFLTDLLRDLPHAVLAGIVVVIGVQLVDVPGLRRIYRRRRLEFVVAVVTAITVCVVGVGAGIVMALVLSLAEVIQREYRAPTYVLAIRADGGYDYEVAAPGKQSEPGLLVVRFDAELFFANASRFVDRVEALVDGAPAPVRWVILDCAGIPDIDSSAGLNLVSMIDYLHARSIHLVLARPDVDLLQTLGKYGMTELIKPQYVYDDLDTAVAAFHGTIPP